MMDLDKKIVVLGAGAWGMTIASVLADNGHHATLWCYEADVAHDIATLRKNSRYLPAFPVHPSIVPTCDLKEALSGASLIFEAIPVAYMRSIFTKIATDVPTACSVPWVFLSKGIEQNTFLMPSQLARNVFNHEMMYAVLGGPNFAVDLMRKSLTATVIASPDQAYLQSLTVILQNNYFKIFLSSDPMGVQACGALKNVIALALGIAEGVGLGHENTSAYLMTQGLGEIAHFVEYVGGNKETTYGLAGVGDMLLTCSGALSKNKRMGKKIGEGLSLLDIATQNPVMPEGINTLQTVHQMIIQQGLAMPLCQAAYAAVFQGKPFTYEGRFTEELDQSLF